MIHTVGQWVFEQVLYTCVRLRSYDPAFCLAFNVSIQQLSDPQLQPFMGLVLKKYQLPGDALVAELTESCLDQHLEKLTDFVNECQKLGIRIATDDFGSDYLSLRMLLQYPFSIIKLDCSLVMEATKSETKMNFIRNIVITFHQLDKIVCVEGVEQTDENEIILNTVCDMIQGYYHYRPMELGDIYQLVSHINTAHEKAERE